MSSLVCQLVCVASVLGFIAFTWSIAHRVFTNTSASSVARFASERGWVSRPAAGWELRYEGQLDGGVTAHLLRRVLQRNRWGRQMRRPDLEVAAPLPAPGCLVVEPVSPLGRGFVSIAERCAVKGPSRVALLDALRDVPAGRREHYEVRATAEHPLTAQALEVAEILAAHSARSSGSGLLLLLLEDEMVLVSLDPFTGPAALVDLAERCRRALSA